MIRCAVIGASGYSGAELVGLLATHSEADLVSVHGESSCGRRWDDLFPDRRHLWQGTIEPVAPDSMTDIDAVFLALPSGAAGSTAARLEGRVGCVIDLSGDLRLDDPQIYQRVYGRPHPAPDLLGRAVYGLPELFGDDLPGARLVACAGCYATAVQLAAAPWLASGGGATRSVYVTASSGSSGAGRRPEVHLSMAELFGDLRPYRVGRHQHVPEIQAGLHRVCGFDPQIAFVPTLAPIARGILAVVTMPADAVPDTADLTTLYEAFFRDQPFVRIVDADRRLPGVRDVVGTNFCDLAPVADPGGGAVVVIAVLDNLLKGAAGQAIQVFERVFGLRGATAALRSSKIHAA